jgi:hypothetical protein
MENIVIISVLATIVFCVMKFIETRYLDKDTETPLKVYVRDAIVVFIATVCASIIYFNMSGYLTDFFNMVTETKTLDSSATEIFTDAPGF